MENNQIIYGIHPVEELLRQRLSSVDHVFFEKGRKSSQLFNLMKFCRKERLSYNLVPEMKLRQLTAITHHQGVAAISSVIPYLTIEQLREILDRKPDPIIVLPASIEDPGNLGAIIRSAVAFGADALLLERKHTTPLSPAVAKSSAGAMEHCAIARPKNLEALLAELIAEGFRVIGTDVKRGKIPPAVALTGPLILVLGGEHRGIPPYLLKSCGELISIPMSNETHSLNVAATAAILLYEITRQRTGAAPLP